MVIKNTFLLNKNHMVVDLKVHVEIVHYKGYQGSNMTPGKF